MKDLLNELELLHIKEGIKFDEGSIDDILKIKRAKERTKVYLP